MDDLNVKAKAERQLALMYAKLSSAHRCLAIAQEDDSQCSKMQDMAEHYFDEAEAIGREALGGCDLYVPRLTMHDVIDLIDAAITQIAKREQELMHTHQDHAYNVLKASGLSIAIDILTHMCDKLAGDSDV